MALRLAWIILPLFVMGCSGGGTTDLTATATSSPVIERTVYLADQDVDDVFELYLVGSSIKLNPALSNGKNVLDFEITPDKTAVVYRADQDTDEVFELYRVEFANPGVSTKLNSPLPAGGDVWLAFKITADSSSVLYVADQATDGILELYRVPFATPGISTKLNGPLVPGGNVWFDIEITPNNSAVVYRATQDTTNAIELYRVPFATPGLSTKLNGILPPDADVESFKITPNNTMIAYAVLQRNPTSIPAVFDFMSELDSVAFASPGQSTILNGPLVPGGVFGDTIIVGQYDITPDSSAVVYTTTGLSGDYRFLHYVPLATPRQAIQLNGSGQDRFIDFFIIRPDSSGVVYAAQADSPVIRLSGTELFHVPFATPGVSTKLNGPLVAGGGLQHSHRDFVITPDNSAIVYGADETTNDVIEIYRVSFSTPGVSTKLNGPLVAGGSVNIFGNGGPSVTPDSSAVLYQASQTTPGVVELYRVPFVMPGGSSKLNGLLVVGGNVENFIAQ